ncbi:hypothetical protein ATANTOWER_016728 [Ataeniobius toweri]|uniref:Uncharacterized protein n=1 Tax=Ataeniobius toweri TaxID=208326 RepID=A0ABU7AG24_9TELE|nr:hypothetical protein [Ataeniobius toweri]
MRTIQSRHVTSPGTAELGSHLGEHLIGEAVVFLAGPGRAKPERETRGHPPVGPPPAGGTMRDRCKKDWAADEGGDLGGPISGCLGWLWDVECHLAGGKGA